MKHFALPLIILGGILILTGVFFLFADKLPFHLGRLPGDINVQGKSGSFHFPVVTCIIISIILTIVVNIIIKLFKH
jgi:hypothetical protein